MAATSLSALFLSFLSLLAASFFPNNDQIVANFDGLDLVDDFANEARKVVEELRSTMAFGAANSTVLIELGAKGQLIAREIGKKCRPKDENTGGSAVIRLHNWGGNFRYSTQNIQYPRTVEEVQQIVKGATKLRVLGCRHSFSKIADSPDTILSTLGMNSILSLNSSIPSVTVQAGIKYTDLCPYLQSVGFALPNLAALAEISVAGGTQTGTHGSGLENANLATQMRSMQMVLANGTVANFGPNSPELPGLAVGLGAFGVLTQIELNLVPTFNTSTYIFMNLPSQNFYDNFDKIEKLGYTVQVVTTLTNTSSWDQILVNVRADQGVNKIANLTELYGATRAPGQVSPIGSLPATYVVRQNVEQPWYYGLVDYGFGLTAADGNEIQSEYFIPYANAVPAIKAVAAISAQIKSVLYGMLVRTIKSDNLWMSGASGIGRETNSDGHHIAIHFSWQANVTALEQVLPKVDKVLLPFSPRPHMGKFFTMKPKDFLKTYPKLDDFKKLANKLDPKGKFRNKLLEENIFVNI